MCDTLGTILPGKAIFAKNSDRSPNEAQALVFYPAAHQDSAELEATYIRIGQVENTFACLLSQPTWIWGAEMGVNEHGVCIGNEAVFTKGAYGKTGLTGMDLVRLGLERGASAPETRDVIIGLLEQYGQGGNCGYDHRFFYDNSFLIMDREQVIVLETAGRNWTYKSYDQASLSNRLSIGTEGDAYSGGRVVDFRGKYSDPLFTHFSGSASRWEQTCNAIGTARDVGAMFKVLRQHDPKTVDPFCQAALGSPCMHAGGLVGDHTTASMVVQLDREIKVWFTGSSTPCISLYKPWKFGTPLVNPISNRLGEGCEAYWYQRELFHRTVIGRGLPEAYYQERDALENSWLDASADCNDWSELSRKALAEEADFYTRWAGQAAGDSCGSWFFKRYWQKKTDRLMGNGAS